VTQPTLDGMTLETEDRNLGLPPRVRWAAALIAALAIVVFASVGLTLLATHHRSTTGNKVKNLSFGVLDNFRRGDSTTSLGHADSGQRWSLRVGTWGVKNEEAYVAIAKPRGNNLAVINMHTGDGTVQVTLAHLVSGVGLVFRYGSNLNYWAVTAAPSFGTWAVERVERGRRTMLGNLGPVSVHSETTVSVHLRGPVIDVAINGQVRKSLTNPSLQTLPWVGLIGYGDGARAARWTNFVASAAAAAPAVTPRRPNPALPRRQTPAFPRRPRARLRPTTTT
jgi:hypothetical protein